MLSKVKYWCSLKKGLRYRKPKEFPRSKVSAIYVAGGGQRAFSSFILIEDESILPVKVVMDNVYLKSAAHGFVGAVRPLQATKIATVLPFLGENSSTQGDPFIDLVNMSMAMFDSGNYVSALVPVEACLIQLLNGQPQSSILGSQDYLISVSNMYLKCLLETGQLHLIQNYDTKIMTLASLRRHHELLALWSCYEGIHHLQEGFIDQGEVVPDSIKLSKHYLHAALNLYTEQLKPKCPPKVLHRARENVQLPALKSLVLLHYQSGEFDLAEKYVKTAIKVASSFSPQSTFEPLCQYATILVKTNRLEESKNLYHKALLLAESPKERAKVLYSLAKVCVVLQMFEEGLHYLEEYITVEKSCAARSTNLAKSLLNVGLTYHQQGEKEKALKYTEEALNMAIELADHHLAQQATRAIGLIQPLTDGSIIQQ